LLDVGAQQLVGALCATATASAGATLPERIARTWSPIALRTATVLNVSNHGAANLSWSSAILASGWSARNCLISTRIIGRLARREISREAAPFTSDLRLISHEISVQAAACRSGVLPFRRISEAPPIGAALRRIRRSKHQGLGLYANANLAGIGNRRFARRARTRIAGIFAIGRSRLLKS